MFKNSKHHIELSVAQIDATLTTSDIYIIEPSVTKEKVWGSSLR